MVKDKPPETPAPPRQPITAEQRAAWIEAALAGSPPLSPVFLERLAANPQMITTETSREFFEVTHREKLGQFRITGLEVGIVVPHGKKTRRTSSGYTFRLYYPPAKQEDLL